MTPNIVPTHQAIRPRDDMVQPNGEAVRELRKDHEWTQQQLADEADVAKRTLEKIEKGERVLRRNLVSVAQALKTDVDRIIAEPRLAAAADGPHTLHPPHALAQETAPALNACGCSLLVVDDEPFLLTFLRNLVAREFPSFEILTTDSADGAEDILRKRSVDIVLADQRMVRRTGIELLEWVREYHPSTARLLMTSFDDIDSEVLKDAINRAQVYYFISKPFGSQNQVLLEALRHAAERIGWRRRHDQLLEELRREKDELKGANERLQEANRRLREELERGADTDALTGLCNRPKIEEIARLELRRRSRYRSALSIGLFEVDQAELRQFQPGTEEVLGKLAGILRASLRELDSLGRLHGGKFMVVARETGAEGAAMLSERLKAKVAATRFACEGQPVLVTLSAGFAIAEAGTDVDQLATMIRLADDALTQARSAGPNRSQVSKI